MRKLPITAETIRRAQRVLNAPRDVDSKALLASQAILERGVTPAFRASHVEAVHDAYEALERVADFRFKDGDLDFKFPAEHPSTPSLMRALAFMMSHDWSSAKRVIDEAFAEAQRLTDPCCFNDPTFGDLMRFAGRIERSQMSERQRTQRRVEATSFQTVIEVGRQSGKTAGLPAANDGAG
ncbi:MAG: hypothetical protein AAGK66_10165 [Pseudomonadota bacterium]